MARVEVVSQPERELDAQHSALWLAKTFFADYYADPTATSCFYSVACFKVFWIIHNYSSSVPKMPSWQHWHKPEIPYSLRESSSLNSRLNSPHFTHWPLLMAIVRLRPNSRRAISSLTLSMLFNIPKYTTRMLLCQAVSSFSTGWRKGPRRALSLCHWRLSSRTCRTDSFQRFTRSTTLRCSSLTCSAVIVIIYHKNVTKVKRQCFTIVN